MIINNDSVVLLHLLSILPLVAPSVVFKNVPGQGRNSLPFLMTILTSYETNPLGTLEIHSSLCFLFSWGFILVASGSCFVAVVQGD
ncbi:hypothetical protein CR513_24536, partial [Mucuna pruriens]